MPATVTHAKSNTIADFTGTITVHNSTLGTQTMMATDLVRPSDWNSAHQASLAVVGSELYSADTYWEPYAGAMLAGVSTMSAHSLSSIFFDPFHLPLQLDSGLLHLAAADGTTCFTNGTTYSAASTGGATRYHTMDTMLALYTAGAGANSTRIESVWSNHVSIMATWARSVNAANSTSSVSLTNALTISFPTQWDASGGATYTSTSSSASSQINASTAQASVLDSAISALVSSYLVGSKIIVCPFNTTLAAGQYHMAANIRESTSLSNNGATAISIGLAFSTQSCMGLNNLNHRAYRRLGQTASNASSCIPLFHGIYATTTTGFPSFVATSDIRNIGSPRHLYWFWQKTSY